MYVNENKTTLTYCARIVMQRCGVAFSISDDDRRECSCALWNFGLLTVLKMARRKNSESIGNDNDFRDNYVEEPDFSDPEDFVDDITDEGETNLAHPCFLLPMD